MADSDDDYDRKRRDKFRGERSSGDSYRSERRDDRRAGPAGGAGGRDDWGERNPFRGGARPRPDYRDYRGPRDRYGSPGREMPPAKRMRPDWGDELRGNPRFGGYDPYLMHAWNEHYAAHSLQSAFGHSMPQHVREPPVSNSDTQPAMLTLKQFLDTQDDGISDSEVLRKYSEYKLEFKRQQLNEFFVAHKDEEWFKNKYHPTDSVKRRREQYGFLKKRVDVFNELFQNGQVKSVSIDTSQTDPLLRLLDTVVIKLEGGTDDDLKILDEKPKDIVFPDRVYEKKTDDDVVIVTTPVEKKVDVVPDEPKIVSPRPVRKSPVSDEEENWDDEDAASAAPVVSPAAAHSPTPPQKKIDGGKEEEDEEEEDNKENKSLKRKRSNSDSSSSSSSSDSSSSSSSSDEDDDDEKLIEKYDLGNVKTEVMEQDENEKDEKEEEKVEQEKEKDKEKVKEKEKEKDNDHEKEADKVTNPDPVVDNDDKESKKDEETSEPEQVQDPENGVKAKDIAIDADADTETDTDTEEKKSVEDTEEVEKLLTEDKPDQKEIEKEADTKTDDKTEKFVEKDVDIPEEKKIESEEVEKTAAIEKDKDEDQTETIDLDKVKDPPMSRALHRTSSIFLRNLAPSITKAEIEAVCQRFDGYLRVAIADPLVERRWYRRGWVTFKRDVNIKEICWSLNNTRLRDCEMGAIINRDLSRRVRPVNGMTAHKTIVRADIKLCAKIAINLDEKFKLWDNAATNAGKPNGNASHTTSNCASYGFKSNNPVLQNITDFLIEEASAEEDELLGITGENKDADNDMIERDAQLVSVLDSLILYLRIVHSVDFYNHCEYPYEDEMPNRCGIIHARGPLPTKTLQNDMQDYIKNFENKMQTFLVKIITIEEEELKNLGSKDAESEVEKFIQANTQELAKDKWLCPLSGKKFKGPEFIRKHIFNKHVEKVDEVRKEVEFFNNYLRDPKRPQLPEHPGSTKRTNSESSGGGYRPSIYPPAYAPPFAAYAPPMMLPGRGGRGFGGGGRRPNNEYRQLIQYRDLDAPQEPVDLFT